MNTVRPRSVSRERATVIDPGDPDAECLDPEQLLSSILSKLTTLDIPLSVTISDNENQVSYPINIFTSKLWPIRDGCVIFGLKRIKFEELKASINFNISIETANIIR
jgi:hypothetical protein